MEAVRMMSPVRRKSPQCSMGGRLSSDSAPSTPIEDEERT
ncbi:hypothetical protein [Azospirillum palustre]